MNTDSAAIAMFDTRVEDACRFLAACYYEPDPAFAEEGLFASLAQALAGLDSGLAASAETLGSAFFAAGPQALLVEYTQLFLGPVDAPAAPYGSLWMGTDPGLMGESTQAVEALYEAGGFELGEEVHELPDHIAIELEFVYAMLFAARQAAAAGDAAAVATHLALARQLLEQHLGRWVGPFAAALEGAAQGAFYRELARLTTGAVTALARHLAALPLPA